MKKAVKVLVVYLLSLLACSLLFNWLGIKANFSYLSGHKVETEVTTMIIPTIIGGIIALKMLVPAKSLKIFLIVYFSLWLLRFILLYAASKVGEVHMFGRSFHIDLIVPNYYQTVSRLQTPLPFILYWFINYFYGMLLKNPEEKEAD